MVPSLSPPALPVSTLDPLRVPTLDALYRERALQDPQRRALRHRGEDGQWRDWSWQALAERAGCYADGLLRAGLRPGDRIALQIANGPDWLAIDWAAHTLGLVVVGLYVEDTPASTAFLLADSGARLAFLRDAEGLAELRRVQGLPELREIVLMQGERPLHERRAQTLARWLPAQGRLPESRAHREQLAALVYTSGSTGRPKGVMLSHAALLANVFACLQAIRPEASDRLLSLLPMAHLYERVVGCYTPLAVGAELCYGGGSRSLIEDLASERPTALVAVPRLFERIHAVIEAELAEAPAPRRALFRLAVEAGWAAQQKGAHPVKVAILPTGLSRRAGETLRQRLGGRLRFAVCGGAPLALPVARTFIALGIPVLQGYGLTEAGPVVSTNRLDDNEPASAGRPLDGVEIRVAPSGELLVKSPALMMGYWQDREATRAVLDEAGWLRTGDKVSRLDTDRVWLTGRLKDILVTANGEKASPADLEQALRQLPLVDQVMVIGEAKPFLAALIVPDPGQLALLRLQLGLTDGDDSAEAQTLLEEAALQACGGALRGFPRHHQIRRVALLREGWSVANQLLTPSQKLRRAAIARRHAEDIERLYAGHYTAPKADCSSNAGHG